MPKMTKASKDQARLRSQRFRAALALEGMTMEEWADGEGITLGHVSHTLAGRRESRILIAKIEAFTAKTLEAHAAVA